MMTYFASFAAIMLLAPVFATNFEKCDDGSPEPNSLMVEGCNAEPCVLKPNEEIVVNVYFTPDHEVTKLTPVVSVESHGNTTGFQLPDKDGCKFLLGFCCPVKANETVRYHLHVDTPPVLIEDVTLTFKMQDQDSKNLACFKVKTTL